MKIILLVIIVILIVLIFFVISYNNKIIEKFTGEISDKIFISIPSYRDTDCKKTLRDLFNKAKNPKQIFVGIFTQNNIDKSDESCDIADFEYAENIRYMKIDYSRAKGPLYARNLIVNNLYQNEKYFLMIDAHTLFIQDWDHKMKQMLEYLVDNGIKKPILSGYPSNITDYEKDIKNNKISNSDWSTIICEITDGGSYPTVVQATSKKSGKFYKGYLGAAGCFFTYGYFFKEINMDPALEYIFNGEEMLFNILAYTNGWDIYSLPYNCIYHKYRTTDDKVNDDIDWYSDVSKGRFKNEESSRKSHEILNNILTESSYSNIYKYKLGTERTLDEFWDKIGYNRYGKTWEEKWDKRRQDKLCNESGSIDYINPN